jgi:hypothetical protein
VLLIAKISRSQAKKKKKKKKGAIAKAKGPAMGSEIAQ